MDDIVWRWLVPPGVVQWPTYRTIHIGSGALVPVTNILHQNERNSFLTGLLTSTLSPTTHSPINNQEWSFQKRTLGRITLQLKTPQQVLIALHKKSKLLSVTPGLAWPRSLKSLPFSLLSPLLHCNKSSFKSPNITNPFLPQGLCTCNPHYLEHSLPLPTPNILISQSQFKLTWPTITN